MLLDRGNFIERAVSMDYYLNCSLKRSLNAKAKPDGASLSKPNSNANQQSSLY